MKTATPTHMLLIRAAMIVFLALALNGQVAAHNSAGKTKVVESRETQTALLELEGLLKPIKTFQAHFEQTLLDARGKRLQRLAGEIKIKKPGYFLWEIQGEEPRKIVSDGAYLWDYDQALSQVIKQKMDKSDDKGMPLLSLIGESDALNRRFSIRKLPLVRKQCMRESETCFELRGLKNEERAQNIQLGFREQKLHEMAFSDPMGQRSQFLFKQVVVNKSLAKRVFQFVLDKETDLVELGSQ